MTAAGDYNQRRRERTRRELDFLRAEFAEWLKVRREADRTHQHASQFAAIEACILDAAQGLAVHLDSLSLSLSRGEFAEQCRLHELRLLWLRRLWSFFRERIDQRDDPRLNPLLRAADELVWSAWKCVFDRAENLGLGLSLESRPTPLPFVELEYSPAATPVSWVPKALCRDGGPELTRYLERLPIALVHLPVGCVTSPWWLVFIGHEVGHHIQHDLGLIDSFQQHLRQAVHHSATRQQVDADAAAARWGRWSQEVFADVFSVVSFGGAAVRAMAEFEQHPESRMAEKRDRYPPAAVRLKLLARLAKALGLPDVDSLLAGLTPQSLVQGYPEAEEDLLIVDAVIAASRAVLPGVGATLEELLRFDASQFTLRWPEVPHPFELSSPRRMASAALAEWSRLEDSLPTAPQLQLAKEVPPLLGANRLPGRRGDPSQGAPNVDGQGLSTVLLHLKPAELEAAARGAE